MIPNCGIARCPNSVLFPSLKNNLAPSLTCMHTRHNPTPTGAHATCTGQPPPAQDPPALAGGGRSQQIGRQWGRSHVEQDSVQCKQARWPLGPLSQIRPPWCCSPCLCGPPPPTHAPTPALAPTKPQPLLLYRCAFPRGRTRTSPRRSSTCTRESSLVFPPCGCGGGSTPICIFRRSTHTTHRNTPCRPQTKGWQSPRFCDYPQEIGAWRLISLSLIDRWSSPPKPINHLTISLLFLQLLSQGWPWRRGRT